MLFGRLESLPHTLFSMRNLFSTFWQTRESAPHTIQPTKAVQQLLADLRVCPTHYSARESGTAKIIVYSQWKQLQRVAQALLPAKILAESKVCPIFKRMKKPANPAKSEYRRRLPHIQRNNKTLFVTFATLNRWELPEIARDLVLGHCLHDNGTKLHMHGLVVMPDHVHMVFSPLEDDSGRLYGLAEIMRGIKGSSARAINKALKRKGSVWQDESFDHLLRSYENIQEKIEYICLNPVRKGLVRDVNDYPWIWREWIEAEE